MPELYVTRFKVKFGFNSQNYTNINLKISRPSLYVSLHVG